MSISKQKFQEQQKLILGQKEDLQQVNVNATLLDQKEELQEKGPDQLEMPVELNKAKLADTGALDDLDDEEYEEHYEEQKESVALNGQYQHVNDKFFGGDGHYMKKLKKELNKESGIQAENLGERALIDYTLDMIEVEVNEGLLKAIQKRMDGIVSICKKYRFFHPFPLSKAGKKRKAEVVAVEEKAKERLKACKDRLQELKKQEEGLLSRNSEPQTALEKMTTSKQQVVNYTLATLPFTFLNIWNTIGMIPSAILWPFASAIKSIKKGKLSSAYHIPHPRSYRTWYNWVVMKRTNHLNDKMQEEKKNNDPQVAGAQPVTYIYNEATYLSTKHWHHYLMMK